MQELLEQLNCVAVNIDSKTAEVIMDKYISFLYFKQILGFVMVAFMMGLAWIIVYKSMRS